MKYFETWKQNGSLSVVYALLVEALFLGYLAFAVLFTAETFLPTATFFAVLFTLSFVLIRLSRYLDLSFPFVLNKKSPMLWLGLLWAFLITAISLIKFPLWSVLLILLGFTATGYLFWKILTEEL